MNSTNYYIELIRPLTDKKSDYAIAKKLGVSRTTISKYKLEKMSLDGDTALTVGAILGINPLVIIAHVKSNNAPKIENQQRWKSLGDQLKNMTKMVGIVTAVIFLNIMQVPDSKAQTKGYAINLGAQSVYYVKLQNVVLTYFFCCILQHNSGIRYTKSTCFLTNLGAH